MDIPSESGENVGTTGGNFPDVDETGMRNLPQVGES